MARDQRFYVQSRDVLRGLNARTLRRIQILLIINDVKGICVEIVNQKQGARPKRLSSGAFKSLPDVVNAIFISFPFYESVAVAVCSLRKHTTTAGHGRAGPCLFVFPDHQSYFVRASASSSSSRCRIASISDCSRSAWRFKTCFSDSGSGFPVGIAQLPLQALPGTPVA